MLLEKNIGVWYGVGFCCLPATVVQALGAASEGRRLMVSVTSQLNSYSLFQNFAHRSINNLYIAFFRWVRFRSSMFSFLCRIYVDEKWQTNAEKYALIYA